jgi:cytochrome c oxidase subunit 2
VGPGIAFACAALAACGDLATHQSALHPAGPQAERLYGLWTFLWITASVVLVLVIGLLLAALLRSRRRQAPLVGPEAERGARRAVTAGAAITLAILVVFLTVSFRTARATLMTPAGESPLRITVTGYQWWWGVDYHDSISGSSLSTANEIHVPVGRTVEVDLVSHDVIHSFWVPNLGGKKDLIPGHHATTWFRADRAGVWRGQCAEFCGHQHALMGLRVIAEPPAEFARWYQAQLAAAAEPVPGSAAARGKQVFAARSCVLCHSVRGSGAGGRVGPDLTHLGSRMTLAAGTIPNDPRWLAAWVTDPQAIKPGNHMPASPLPPEELQALVAYLRGLR